MKSIAMYNQDELNSYLNKHCNLTGLYKSRFHNDINTIVPFGGGSHIVEGFKYETAGGYGWQKVTSYWGRTWYRKQGNGTWSGWEEYVLRSDLLRQGVTLNSYLDPTHCDSSKDNLMYGINYINTVNLNFVMGPKNLTGDDIMGLLPEKFRPIFTICLPVSARDGVGEWKSGNYYPAFLRIEDNGSLHLITGTNASKIKYVNGFVTYCN